MDDLQQLIENLNPEAQECIESILERMAMATIRKHTMKMVFEMNFDQGVLFDSFWKEQMAGKRKRTVRSRGI